MGLTRLTLAFKMKPRKVEPGTWALSGASQAESGGSQFVDLLGLQSEFRCQSAWSTLVSTCLKIIKKEIERKEWPAVSLWELVNWVTGRKKQKNKKLRFAKIPSKK